MQANRRARAGSFEAWRAGVRWAGPVSALAALAAALLASGCGGGGGSTGNERDSGTNKTYLSVDASDADGDALQYQWRVTAGTVDNRNARETVWTMPDGPGLHFAYVSVSDGKGGHVEQQYSVSSDALNTAAPVRQPLSHTAPAVSDFSGAMVRLRFISPDDTRFSAVAAAATGTAATTAAAVRYVYLPDVQVRVVEQTSGLTVFSGVTDASGEISLPKLAAGQSYGVNCASSAEAPLADCLMFTAGTEAGVLGVVPALTDARNLRLHGHVDLADSAVCGAQSEFFGTQSAATVQLLAAGGGALGPPLRVNRFGDYALDAAVPVNAALQLKVACEGYQRTLDVPAAGQGGYAASRPVELSHRIANSRPRIVKMVANGPEGNVRGQMVVLSAPTAVSNALAGAQHFLSYKGNDTRLSACRYYRALGAVKDCDAQGNLIEPISFDDWKRQHKLKPYAGANPEVAANYINRWDLNLVRRMVATQSAPDDIAFYVCNSPGPDGATQREVDDAVNTALADQKRVACVAMEWSTTPGVNGGRPFTKFLTFGPDGSLLPSINLDGRGEKYMPGTCVACHGGLKYNGRFPDKGDPSPDIGSAFLAFDTGNYLFGSGSGLSEAAQSESIWGLNQLVRATDASEHQAAARLIDGWYARGNKVLDKAYVPKDWQIADAQPATAGAARFYHEVVGASCRTCHASLGARYDWDTIVLNPARAQTQVCGGTADVALNATMPNALTSRDRVEERTNADPALAALMTRFLGCAEPLPDPVYPRR